MHNAISEKKHIMWYKVNNLKEIGLNNSQISRNLSIHRQTVSRYLSMSEEEFKRSGIYSRTYTSILDGYRDSILSHLEFCSDLSASQIHDLLRESDANFPLVHDNTILNYVTRLRQEYNIPKKESKVREFSKQPESEFGKYAQVDFGEKWVYTLSKRSVKLYFFAIVLCRSRYKYIYIQGKPFTTKTAIYAHEKAFEYFGGIPQNIIYDQDKVFISNENLGDYLLTNEFRGFVSKHHFNTIFCRKSDPQSKGKVENVVKYVKNNFLKGRPYSDIDSLNTMALSWLDRTGNGLTHNSTRLIPSVVFKQEKEHLLPYHGIPQLIEEVMKSYTVRKDNTVSYRSNFYSLPLGTYKGIGSAIYMTINGEELIFYDKESGKTITTHKISNGKGKLISKSEHRKRDKSTVKELENEIINTLGQREEVKLYLDNISKTKERYYLDNIRFLHKHLGDYSADEFIEEIINQINLNMFNCQYLISYLGNKSGDKKEKSSSDRSESKYITNIDITPAKRDINSYITAIQQKR